jgi:IclR family acetate operon transcriptional repressor
VLGPRVALLADAFLRDGETPAYLTTPLRTLAAETGETAYLTAWRGTSVAVLDSCEGANAVRVGAIERGPYTALHARASGKLLLAFAKPELRRAAVGREPFERRTPHTIVTQEALDVELATIRERGWAEDVEEFIEGVACVAVPALVDGVALAAYTVLAPRERYDRTRDELLAAARRAAASALEHRPDPDPMETP